MRGWIYQSTALSVFLALVKILVGWLIKKTVPLSMVSSAHLHFHPLYQYVGWGGGDGRLEEKLQVSAVTIVPNQNCLEGMNQTEDFLIVCTGSTGPEKVVHQTIVVCYT